MDKDFFGVALSLVPGIGGVLYKKLINHFNKAEAVFRASFQELIEVEDIGFKTALAIKKFDKKALVEENIFSAKRIGARIVLLEDEDYPVNLLNISNPPPVLFIKGELSEEDRFAAAVIGSRDPSRYGESVAASISRDLAADGMTLVSGMARGIDSISHREALRAGGRTIAVLGSGIDVIYPPENRGLFDKIIHSGAVVTEFPMSTPPNGINFPNRNRIISGLSLGVVIVEAGMKSGSLITAQCAIKQGREVFAVPGKIGYAGSRGTNKLIKDGGKLVENAKDVMDVLSPQFGDNKETPARSEVESILPKNAELILDTLTEEPLHIDDVAIKSRLNIKEVSTLLLHLEMSGFISQLPGKIFMRNL